MVSPTCSYRADHWVHSVRRATASQAGMSAPLSSRSRVRTCSPSVGLPPEPGPISRAETEAVLVKRSQDLCVAEGQLQRRREERMAARDCWRVLCASFYQSRSDGVGGTPSGTWVSVTVTGHLPLSDNVR